MEVELPANHSNYTEIKPSQIVDSSTKLDQSIKQIVKREGFIKYQMEKRCLSTNGGNYLATLYEFDVKGRTKDGDKELNIFVKQIIDTILPDVISVRELYNLELFVYKDLCKIFTDLQVQANVPKEEIEEIETSSEAIIMDNLTKAGFMTYHRLDIIPLKFAEEAIKQLARFHALSFVLKEKRPEYFDKKIKSIKYPITFEDGWINMIEGLRDTTVANVDEEYKEKAEKIYQDVLVKYPQFYSEESTKACLCHGDYRPNNILVKLNEDESQEIVPIDYQIIHYGSPVFDFLYFMYLCTDREFRKCHMLNLKDLYYETLKNFLKYFNLDAHLVYSREEFERVFEEKREYSLLMAMKYLPLIMASEGDLPDLNQESILSFKVDKTFKNRICDVIEEFEEWGYI